MNNIIRKANLSSGLRFMFVLLTVLVLIGTAEAATYTVTNTNDSGVGSLREAISQANGTVGVADTIEFEAGLSGAIVLTTGPLPTITDELTISGPGAGVLTVSGNSTVRVFNIATGVTISISGLTISNGNAGLGGGISNAGTLMVTNSTLSGNSATGAGGIFNAGTATLTITDSMFTGNSASSSGGGIINSLGGELTINNSTFSDNSGPSGGGIINLGALTIIGSTFSGNSAPSGNGGGIVNVGSLTITGSTFYSNSAVSGGGVVNAGTLTVTITNSTFSGNSATIGGGIRNAGPMTITNSTISGNSANSGLGGGIENEATLTITSSTISGNSATSGGGILNFGPVTLKNSIIADSPSGGNCAGPTPITAVEVNFSTDDTCGAEFTQVTPEELKLGPLQDNGGPTQTHALLAGSVAIDAVTDCTDLSDPSVAVATDQRGVSRPQGPACDVGAFELETQSPVICPLPQGYWKNNPDAWPVTSLALGSATYTQAELLAILNTPIGTGKNADASLILADKLIAAKLSVANGSDPTPISATMTTADELLAQFSGKLPYLVKPSSIIGNQMTVLAAFLEQYNTGLLTGCTP
jgi:hypothetical protein